MPDESILAWDLGDYVAADFSCRGVRSRPTGSPPMPYRIHIVRWGGGAAGATAWFFAADAIDLADAGSAPHPPVPSTSPTRPAAST